jgi:hypothetical protein
MEAAIYAETLVRIYQGTWHCTPILWSLKFWTFKTFLGWSSLQCDVSWRHRLSYLLHAGLLLGLFFHPEDWGDKPLSLWNVCWLSWNGFMSSRAVDFNLGYEKTSHIKQNETQEPLEPCTSSDPHTQEDSSPNWGARNKLSHLINRSGPY